MTKEESNIIAENGAVVNRTIKSRVAKQQGPEAGLHKAIAQQPYDVRDLLWSYLLNTITWFFLTGSRYSTYSKGSVDSEGRDGGVNPALCGFGRCTGRPVL
ncbi:hypothetical protein ACNKHO_19695 [Shigella flexneri]